MEYFRLDDSGHLIAEDQYMLSSRSYGGDQNGPFSGPFPFFQSWFSGGGRDYDGSPRYVAPPRSNYQSRARHLLFARLRRQAGLYPAARFLGRRRAATAVSHPAARRRRLLARPPGQLILIEPVTFGTTFS